MKFGLALCGALAALAVAPAAHARIHVGDQLVLAYDHPEVGDPVYTSYYTFTGDGQSISTAYAEITLYSYQAIFGTSGDYEFTGGDYNGPVLYDISQQNPFGDWKLKSDDIGLTGTYLSDGAIGVNWSNINVNEGYKAVIASAAPEPATWALMMVGVGLAGAGLRRARWRAVAA